MKVTIRADMSKMHAGIDSILAQFLAMPESAQREFARRYDGLAAAGAEGVEVETGADCMRAVIGDDMRRLCAEFGIVV